MIIKNRQFLLISIFIFAELVISIAFPVDPLLMVLLALYFFTLVIYAGNPGENIFMIFFLATFFVFLLGRPIAENFFNIKKVYTASMTDEATQIMYCALILSIIGLVLGYWSAGRFRIISKRNSNFNGINRIEKEYTLEYIETLKVLCRSIYIIFGLLLIVENSLRMFFVFQYNYEASFVSYVSIFPSFLDSIIDTTPVVFALFLATLPSKRECKLPFIIYIANAVVYALIGLRYEFISSFMLMLLYYYLRNRTDDEKWITRRNTFALFLLLPLVIVLLQFMSAWRAGSAVSETVKSNPFGEFLYAIGGSSNLIGYQHMHHDQLAAGRNIPFSFGYIINSLRSNVIAKILGVQSLSFVDRTEQALHGYSFDRAISYYVYRNQYLNGYGAGSCYIAELMFDFSYVGVFIGNFLYGYIIKRIRELKPNKLINNFLCIFLSTLFFRVCRDSFSYPLEQFISLRNILLIIILITITQFIVKRKYT